MKCKDCKHFDRLSPSHSYGSGRCLNPEVQHHLRKRGIRGFHTINEALEFCFKRSSRRHEYFEPQPSAGAAFATGTSPTSPTTPELALKAAA